jgi:hypothetical protein
MLTIQGVEYNLKITNSVLFRYASSQNMGVGKLVSLLQDITPDHLVGVIVFAINQSGGNVTTDMVWTEIDERIEVFTEMANVLNEQLNSNVPASEQKKRNPKAVPKVKI